MRHLLALLGSLALHGVIFGAAVLSINHIKEKTQAVAIEAVNFDLGMMAAAKIAPVPAPQQSQATQAQTTTVEQEPVTEPEPVAEPEPIIEPEPAVEPEPVVVPKPVVKPKVKKKIKSKKKPKKKPPKKTKPKKKKVKQKAKSKPKTNNIRPKKTKATTKTGEVTSLPTSTVATVGVGKKTANQIGNQGKRGKAKGGKGSSNRGSANANSYKASLRAAIGRVANRLYPRSAQRMRKQGTVRVRFNLARNGRISAATVVSSSGHRILDKAAVKALKKLGKYKPPPPGVPSTLTVPIRFKLPK